MQVIVEFVCFVTAFLPTVSNYVIQRSSEMVHDVKEFFDVRENFLGLLFSQSSGLGDLHCVIQWFTCV